MSTEPTHFPHCPYCNSEWASNGYYVCGTFNNSGCHDTFPQSALCRERSARIKAETELAATKLELEECRKSNVSLQSRVAVLEHELIRAHADGEQVAHAANLAESRVLELEGLIVIGRTSDCVTVMLSQGLQDVPPTTLGDAMGGGK